MDRLRVALASLPAGLVESAWLVVAMRVALLIFGAYVASERTIPHPCHFEEARNGWPAMPLQYKDGAAFRLFGVWERWDACWYARIATFGYTPDGSTAFFPLFPLLERVVAFFGPHVVVAGMVINVIALTLALWGLHRIAARDHGERVARRALLLLSVFPAAFFLLAPFSEAVFLAAAVWSIERARDRRWLAAAILAALAGLARPVGGFLVLPIAWLAWQGVRDAPRAEQARRAAAVAAAPVAGFLYVVYTVNGVGRSMFDASADWTGSAFHAPWDVVGAALDFTRRTGDPLQALQLAMLVGFAVLFVLGIRRLPAELTLYAAPQLALAWGRILPIPLTSVDRYLLVIFPAFIVLALVLGDRRWRWSYVILSLLLLGALANEFVIGNFVG
jgi:hypothetical protein